MKPHSQKFIQKRKFYMALPVLVIPFVTMFFWALGGGKGIANAKSIETVGLNLSLPNARFSDESNSWDKLSLYQKARRDSLKFNQAKKNDPYFRLTTLKLTQDTSRRDSINTRAGMNASLGEKGEPLDQTEAKVYQKLTELQKHIEQPARQSSRKSVVKAPKPKTSDKEFQSDVDRLESMMLMMQDGKDEDQEMQEINGVLNKILDVQHPERVKARVAANSNDANAYSVQAGGEANNIGLITRQDEIANPYETNGFYGLEEAVFGLIENNAVMAEIYGNQNLVSGSVVKLVLLQDISVNGTNIPTNQFVFGVCALNGERLSINITSIQYSNSIYPVALSVYDVDGLEGVHVPGAIAREAAKKSSNQTLNDIQLNSLDPSLEVQAASAGIEAAKGILSKKTRLIQVTVKAGYQVYLKDKNSQSSNSKP
jgi:conjugative transposon TraM protein